MNRSTKYVIGMSVLGLATLAVPGWLMQARAPRVPVPVVAAPGKSRAPLSTLAQGVATSIDSARRSLTRGRRADAVASLDAAMRASDVARDADGRERGGVFGAAYDAVQRARRGIQNGSLETAEAALAGLDRALWSPAARPPDVQLTHDDLSRYEGATLIDAYGAPIGEVKEFQHIDGADTAVLRIGGWQDFMGIFDLGGQDVRVEVDALVFGRPRRFGGTTVALVTPVSIVGRR